MPRTVDHGDGLSSAKMPGNLPLAPASDEMTPAGCCAAAGNDALLCSEANAQQQDDVTRHQTALRQGRSYGDCPACYDPGSTSIDGVDVWSDAVIPGWSRNNFAALWVFNRGNH
jgi:hypothetical protein